MGKKIKIDTFVSKMGRDQDIMTISFKVFYKNPAEELVDFFEKGYDWILDADVSTGTVQDGSWLVFIEIIRRPSVANKLMNLLKDMKNINAIDPREYIFKYRHEKEWYKISETNLELYVPMTPRAYNKYIKEEGLQEDQLRRHAYLPYQIVDTYDSELKDYVNLSRTGSWKPIVETGEGHLLTSRNILSINASPYELTTLMKEFRSEDPTYNEIGNNAMVTFYSKEEKEEFEKFLKKKKIKYTEVGDG